MWPAAWGKHRMLLVNYPCRWTVLRVVCRHVVHSVATIAAVSTALAAATATKAAVAVAVDTT